MRKFLRRFFAELSARVRLAGSQLIKIHTTTDTAKKSVKQGITVSLFQRASYAFFDAVNFRPALFFMDAGFRPARSLWTRIFDDLEGRRNILLQLRKSFLEEFYRTERS